MAILLFQKEQRFQDELNFLYTPFQYLPCANHKNVERKKVLWYSLTPKPRRKKIITLIRDVDNYQYKMCIQQSLNTRKTYKTQLTVDCTDALSSGVEWDGCKYFLNIKGK